MNKQKIMAVLKVVIFILAIICLVSLLRFQAGELASISPDYQDTYKDPNGLPYFTEMDSYYNLRMTNDLMTNGHMGNVMLPNGTPWDTLSYAPDGRSADYTPLLSYVTIFLYNVANMFSDVSLTEVAFYASCIITPFSVIPAYIIVRRITNDYGGITAALMVSLSPNFFSHTFAGFFDTDMLAVLIPLFMILFFIESIRSNKFIYRLLFAIATVLSLAIFALAWNGYIFYIAVLVAFIIVYLVLGILLKLNLIKPRKEYPNVITWIVNQREIFSIVFITVLGFIALSLTKGVSAVLSAPFELLGLTQLQAIASVTAFPNVAISIAELQIPNILSGGIIGAFTANGNGIVNGMGGIIPLFGVLIIFFVLIQRLWNLGQHKVSKSSSKKPPKSQREATSKVKGSKGIYSIIDHALSSIKTKDDVFRIKRETLLYLSLFGTWILLTILALTQGSRFIREFMIPVGLCVGWFVGWFVNYIKTHVDNKHYLMVIATVGAALIALPIWQTLTIFYPMFKLSDTLVIIIPSIIFLAIIGFSALLIYGIKGIKNGLKSEKSSKFAKVAVMIIVMLAVVTPTVFSAYQVSLSITPSTSDPMWDSMLWVKANTTNDTTMASWWDFGYLFEIASKRPTLFDGGSQTGIRAYWTGKAMTTNDTNLSASIFTMLANSGDRASEQLDNYTNNSGKTAEILEKTLILPKDQAKTTMTGTYHLTSQQADVILNMTHPENPIPVIFVGSSDMLSKAAWWTYFGNWDFDAQNSHGYRYVVAPQQGTLVQINSSTSQANITNEESYGITYKTVITKGVGNNTTNATTAAVFTSNGSNVIVNNTTYNPFTINKLIVIEDNIIWKNETVNSTGNYTLLVIGNNKTYTSIIMSKELENAMFTKLFILVGFGQDTYELVHMENGVSLWQIKGMETRTQGAINSANNTSGNNS